jgi:hypothetical protein
MDKTFRGKRLHIRVDNAAHHEGGAQCVLINGKAAPSDLLTDDMLSDGDQITVIM